ncbi:DUF4097 family beta strand repeat-containing protein [Dermatobacter hominis]|uniref:DUF4097 family beta strand repeat-containing protein n=1 Tax=Dermatobacter hominis TaxID=2884263 RepID=UPI001D0F7CA5|nr:DUF4097 family beta strand repeat-containing protein [Dermatobacter hominis]UDY35874.1 DUF4097 family beta strand repeat-containing protein [Dermatobacter hominis]
MPTFETPRPITVHVDVVGDVRVDASDRTDTVVSVVPRDPSSSSDAKAARDTTVELTGDELLVRTPKHWKRFTPFGGSEIVEVTISVPTGSQLVASTGLGDIRTEGELGPCRVKSAMGDLRLDRTADLKATTAFGDITVDHVDGDAEVSTSSGDVRVGLVSGALVVKNSNGPTELGRIDGDLRVRSANGDILVERAGRSAVAKTANGDIRLHDVRNGSVVMETAAGDIEVGVRRGVAAWLDVNTRFGTVRNDLDAADGPAATDGTVEVRATTATGDITIRRAAGSDAATSG